MYCRNCGVEINDNQEICIKCGVTVGKGNSFCSNCGNTLPTEAEYCMNCGVAVKPEKASRNNTSTEYLGGQDKITIALICFFVGGIGIHNFILGEKNKGVMKIVFAFIFGISSILALIEFIKILTDKYEIDQNKYF